MRTIGSVQYLDASDVEAAMPAVGERLEIAERVLRLVGNGASTSGRSEVLPRHPDSSGYATVAEGDDVEHRGGVLGVSWITEYAHNPAHGLSSLHAIVILDDPDGVRPRAVLDGTAIVCARSAAVSGVSIRYFGPKRSNRSIVTGLVGAGVQAAAHLNVLGLLQPGVDIVVWDRYPDRAQELVFAAKNVPGVGSAYAVLSARDAVTDADIVITTTPFGSVGPRISSDWLRDEVLIVAEDGDGSVAADVALSSSLFLTDDQNLFDAARREGKLKGYPSASRSIGRALNAGARRPGGHVLVVPLGTSLIDLIFAKMIRDRFA
jgi:ornithine cyclodeaminase/alanine dehydrogenase-like protein (mu-crystallin family)